MAGEFDYYEGAFGPNLFQYYTPSSSEAEFYEQKYGCSPYNDEYNDPWHNSDPWGDNTW